MIEIRVLGRRIFPETLASCIIIMLYDSPVQVDLHLIPKWLLERITRLLVPAMVSLIPCASLIAAGTPVRFISAMARSLNWLI